MISTKASKVATKRGIRITSRVKAGGLTFNHNQAAKGQRVKSRVKAGSVKSPGGSGQNG